MKTAFVLLLGSLLMAQTPGTFSATGSMSTERMGHTATLLTSGKVLIAGGSAILSDWAVWASAELYDLSTGTFTATGNMTTPRVNHTATPLPNGKVLITGGYATPDSIRWPVLASAELYDPSAGTFTATGRMTTARTGHTATLLNNGKVLIAGGSRGDRPTSAELYDPATETFTATGEMITPGRHTATLLSNGKVLLEGSYGSGDNDRPAGNELYDPGTGTFSPTGGKAYPNLFPVTASLLTNGKVLVTLEYDSGPTEFAEVYDPLAGTSAATGNMSRERGYSTGTPLPDGKVLVAGRDWANLGGGSAELYDPVAGTFSTPADMVTHREEGYTATLLPDGTVLMTGGWLCCGYSINTAEIYHPVVLAPSPVLFSLSGDGKGPGAILHSGTHQIVSSSNPAVPGEALEIYGAGLTDGSVIPPQVAIGGRMAEVLFFGKAPGFAGLNQVNVRVPSGVAPGFAVSVRLTYLGRPSNEVTIGVQ